MWSKLEPFDEKRDKLVDSTLFRSITGACAWVAERTRPDVLHACRMLQQQQHRPSEKHLHAAHELLRYLRSTPTHGVVFRRGASVDPVAYSDANFAQDSTEDARSTSGGVIFVAGGPVCSFSRRQGYTSTSTEEAEFGALWETVSEALRVRNLVRELCPSAISVLPVTLYCDNQAVVTSISSSYPFQTKLRNIRTKERWAAEQVQRGAIVVKYVSIKLQTADIFTKALTQVGVFMKARDALSVFPAKH
jgi:hypothetical protein